VDARDAYLGLVVQVLEELLTLVMMVDELNRLLETDGDDEADDDGGDVDEEVFPGVDGLVGRVDVERGWPPGGYRVAGVWVAGSCTGIEGPWALAWAMARPW
jgi:hypothetical protein